jgi:C_GCAxxG_C_C family probable redox protein
VEIIPKQGTTIMGTRIEQALSGFRSDRNCAQVVAESFADIVPADAELLSSLACGFGAGMGRLQNTCGALTGATMIIGALSSRVHAENRDRKEHAYGVIRELHAYFVNTHGATDCRSLVRCDLSTEAGREFFREHHIAQNVCEQCIRTTVTFLEQATGTVPPDSG